jgi:preprotein translocase SecE subunit
MSAERAKMAETGGAPQRSERVKEYFGSLKYEWQKITFPDKKQLTNSVIVVFIFCIFLMLVVSLYDLVIGWFFRTFVLPSVGG